MVIRTKYEMVFMSLEDSDRTVGACKSRAGVAAVIVTLASSCPGYSVTSHR